MTGGWFVRFADGGFEWENLSSHVEKLLIQLIRKGDPRITLTLSYSNRANENNRFGLI